MDLRQLTYFQMVCRLKNFTKTAEKLNVSQPSVTVAIRKLEEELGVTLLERSRKQVLITPAGEIFLQRVNAILNAVENVRTEMRDFDLSNKEKIRIGIPPMVGSYLLPHLFTEFEAARPNIVLDLMEIGSSEIQRLLEAGELDIGLVVLQEALPNFKIEKLKHGEIRLILSPDHPFNELSTIPFNLLKNEPFILMPEGTHIRNIIMETCAEHEFEPRIAHTSSQITTTNRLVNAGVGISFMPDIMVQSFDSLSNKPFTEPLYIHSGLIWRKNKVLSSATKELIHFIKEFSIIDK